MHPWKTTMNLLARALSLLLLATPAWALDLSGLTAADASGGVKEALTQGAAHAVDALGRQGGFLDNPKVKIPLPAGLKQAESLLRLAGKGKDLDQLVTTMNQAAEAAVPEARTLLLKAVQDMTVQDAKDVLAGGDDAVTRFFRGKTEARLTQLFLPVVKKQTDRLAVSVQYNKLAAKAAGAGLVKGAEAQIETYVTREALDGLYLLVAEEERKIRRDPGAAAGALARKAFGAL
jgi:Protein of unknown function (DUF4197)